MLIGAGTQVSLSLQNEEAEDDSDGDNGQVNAYHAPDSFSLLETHDGKESRAQKSKVTCSKLHQTRSI